MGFSKVYDLACLLKTAFDLLPAGTMSRRCGLLPLVRLRSCMLMPALLLLRWRVLLLLPCITWLVMLVLALRILQDSLLSHLSVKTS